MLFSLQYLSPNKPLTGNPMSNKLTVVKSNRIVEASYELTLNEQRLILMCIAKIKRGDDINADTIFEISVSEFATRFGLTMGRSYSQLQDATERLYERSVSIKGISSRPNKPKIKVIKSRWISNIRYLEGEGGIHLQFSPVMIPYISHLHSEFTIYDLESISKMSSTYSIRIYELLTQWVSVGKRSISVEELREILCLENKYKAVKDLKARVINPAIKEINNTSDLNVSYEQYKEGRSIKGFDFLLEKKQSLKLKVTKEYIEQHARAGETYQQAEQRLRKALEEK